jgi:hypothetical protein
MLKNYEVNVRLVNQGQATTIVTRINADGPLAAIRQVLDVWGIKENALIRVHAGIPATDKKENSDAR